MENVAAVILAAGKGTRMKSGLVKVLHPLAGRPMVAWPIAAARAAGATQVVLVVGHLPSLASLAGSLLGSLAEQPLWFHKSSLAALHCETRDNRKPRVKLEWMISPAMAKRLAVHHHTSESASSRKE